MPNTFTKGNIQTAIWGGGLGRISGLDGVWLSISTGHQAFVQTMGTGSDPNLTLSVVTNADDLATILWQPLSTIWVKKCRIYFGEGGSVNTNTGETTFTGFKLAGV